MTKDSAENEDNLSLVIHKKGDLRLEQTPIPSDIGPNGKKYNSNHVLNSFAFNGQTCYAKPIRVVSVGQTSITGFTDL